MRKPIVFLFSGQGSQYYGMGRALLERQPVFRKWMERLDATAVALTGASVLERIYDSRAERGQKFDRTRETHPAIFMVEYALAQVLLEQGVRPDYVLGSSMGEYAAAAVAGVMTAEDALECLIKQAELLEARCAQGGMLAVLHDPGLYREVPLLRERSELVAVNFDSHFVLSASGDNIRQIQQVLRDRSVPSELLPVSLAFHSPLIDAARAEYLDFLQKKSMSRPAVPFVSGMTGRVMESVQADYFWDVVRAPMRFAEAVRMLEENGPCLYLDLGPAGTQAGFAKRNLGAGSQSQTHALIAPYAKDDRQLQKLLAELTLQSIPSGEEGIRMTTYVFPGQGSQKKGMGETLFDEFAELTAQADRILGYSIKDMCLNNPGMQLNKTQFTQPALYVVNALSYLKKVQETGKKPDFVAGHSLGEYNALFAAGVFDFATGLRLVQKRGELMSRVSGGGMAAVLGFTEEQVAKVLKEKGLCGLDIANLNAPTQIIIAGLKSEIERAKPVFEEAGVRNFLTLNVSGAFHSRYMEESKKSFAQFLDAFAFAEPEIPVISNVHARPYRPGEIRENLLEQITHPVRWTDTVRYLMGRGEMEIEEVGPGNVLTKLVATIRKEAEPLVIAEEKAPQSASAATADGARSTDATSDGGKTDHASALEDEALLAQQAGGRTGALRRLTAETLGDEQFKKDYNLRYAYITGGMYRGIASEEMVIRIGKSGMMGFFGTGGLSLERIESAIRRIQGELRGGEAYGMNLLHQPGNPAMEEQTVDLYLRHGIRTVEASAYMAMTSAIVRYRAKGLRRDSSGRVVAANRVIGKVSRPEVAEAFLSPAPERIVEKLLEERAITREEAAMLREVPVADDLSVEADSGGHTDHGVAYALLPAMLKLRDDLMGRYRYAKRIRIGAAGGIGTPEAAAAAFMLGADYIVTGSINQCTVEAGTSASVKDLLQQANVQDTEYAPAGDLFEMGAKIQVLKRGVFFPARANKLYELYRHYNSLDEIDEKTKKMLEEKYFKRTFDAVFQELRSTVPPQEIERAERTPKYKIALVFKWYFSYTTQLALEGVEQHRVDYQIHCGPALGAFNQWVKGTPLEPWKNRRVDAIAEHLMNATAELLNQRILLLVG